MSTLNHATHKQNASKQTQNVGKINFVANVMRDDNVLMSDVVIFPTAAATSAGSVGQTL
jgi:hypothetical protein